jgi:hypothetical protein
VPRVEFLCALWNRRYPGKFGNLTFFQERREFCEMKKKPKQVLFVRHNPDSIKKLEERLAAIDAMQRQLTTKSGRSVHQERRSAPLRGANK